MRWGDPQGNSSDCIGKWFATRASKAFMSSSNESVGNVVKKGSMIRAWFYSTVKKVTLSQKPDTSVCIKLSLIWKILPSDLEAEPYQWWEWWK